MLDFLARLGLSAVQFEGSSDLRINGRKLGALTAQDIVACDCVGGFVNLSKPDLDLYLSVARVPDEKFKDKVVKDLREYVITAEEIAGHPVGYEDFRVAVLGALDSAGIAWEAEPFTDKERERLSRGVAKVASDDWVRRISTERFSAAARRERVSGSATTRAASSAARGSPSTPTGWSWPRCSPATCTWDLLT